MSSLSIRVEGLAETLKGLREIDRELPKEVKRGLREDVRPLCSLSILRARPRRLRAVRRQRLDADHIGGREDRQ